MSLPKTGFTLIEVLIVVLIIGILSTLALPQYTKAVERSRMTEAITLLDALAQSQQRHYMNNNLFATNYATLDVAPKGASGSLYYSHGNSFSGENGNGFAITLNGWLLDEGYAEAVRYIHERQLRYQYTLVRFYMSQYVTCESDEPNGQSLCADFCGIDNPAPACCSDGTSGTCYDEGTEES